MYFIYLVLLFCIFLFVYKIFHEDLFIPPVMMTFCFLICSIIVVTRYTDWNVGTFSMYSGVMLLIGIISYIIGGCISYYFGSLFELKHRVGKLQHLDIRKRIDISLTLLIIANFIGIIELVLFARYVINTVLSMNYNHSTFAKLLFSYRWVLMRNLIPVELSMPTYLSFLKYTVEMFSAFAIYVYIHNKCMKCSARKDRLLILVSLYWPLNALLTSSRGDIITLLAEIIYLIYFFNGINRGFSANTSARMLGKSVKILIVFLFFFFLFSVYQYRISSNNTFCNSITVYFAGGVRAFDIFVKEPLERNTGLIGNDETLRYFSTFFAVHRGQGQKTLLPLEFRYIKGKSIGNIFTAFRRYYSDFGIGGIIFFSIMLGFVMTLLYAKSRSYCQKRENCFYILAFAWLSKSVFFMAIEDYFYVSIISLNGIYKERILYILYMRLVKNKKLLKLSKKKVIKN